MLTDKLKPYTRQRLSNAWRILKNRIERETGQPVAWWLPFKHLRKTAAQFDHQVSDGEIAGVFLSHGQPVESDALADHYSNRPFPQGRSSVNGGSRLIKAHVQSPTPCVWR